MCKYLCVKKVTLETKVKPCVHGVNEAKREGLKERGDSLNPPARQVGRWHYLASPLQQQLKSIQNQSMASTSSPRAPCEVGHPSWKLLQFSLDIGVGPENTAIINKSVIINKSHRPHLNNSNLMINPRQNFVTNQNCSWH